MADGDALGPGEVLTLLEPGTAKGRDGLKLTLMALLMRGALRFMETEKKGLMGTKRRKVLVEAKRPERLDAPAAAVLAAIGPLGEGRTMDEAVKRLRKAFGKDLSGFREKQLLLSLVRRGLIEPRPESFLLLFTRTRYHPTPAGERERARLAGLMEEARRIPSFITSDPAQALAIVAGLGAAVLLVEELRPHLQQLGQALGPQLGAEGDLDFDFSEVEGIDEDLSAMDASFDAAADSGGSDGGGGDGGGGGGGD